LDAAAPAREGVATTVIRVKVVGAGASEPLLSELTASYGVEVNILRAQIDRLNNTPYAFFVIRLSGTPESLEKSVASLHRKGIDVTQIDAQETPCMS
jgi:ABC-type methionine transport system ATPase subunit